MFLQNTTHLKVFYIFYISCQILISCALCMNLHLKMLKLNIMSTFAFTHTHFFCLPHKIILRNGSKSFFLLPWNGKNAWRELGSECEKNIYSHEHDMNFIISSVLNKCSRMNTLIWENYFSSFFCVSHGTSSAHPHPPHSFCHSNPYCMIFLCCFTFFTLILCWQEHWKYI